MDIVGQIPTESVCQHAKMDRSGMVSNVYAKASVVLLVISGIHI